MDFSNLGTVLMEAWPLLWEGLQTTVFVTVVSLVVAMLLGILTCLMNLSKIAPLRGIAKFYIWIIRGTPMLVQAFYLYFAVPQLLQATIAPDFRLDVITASIITLILNAGAYIAEIFRGAIQSVDKGQMEASRSLGVGHATTMRKIILPQAVRICLPSRSKAYVGRTMESFATYTWVAIIFLVITSVLMLVSSQLEKRMRK